MPPNSLEAVDASSSQKTNKGKCGLETTRRDIFVFTLRAEGDCELGAAFASAKTLDAPSAMSAIGRAFAKYTEAGSSKEAQDLATLEACLATDLAIERVRPQLVSGPEGDASAVLQALESAQAAYKTVTVLRASKLRAWIARASGLLEQIGKTQCFVEAWLNWDATTSRLQQEQLNAALAKVANDATKSQPSSMSSSQVARMSKARKALQPPPAALQCQAALASVSNAFEDVKLLAKTDTWKLALPVDALDNVLEHCEQKYAQIFPDHPLPVNERTRNT